MEANAYDVAVIGAGPAGSFTSMLCARKGLKTILIDQKREPGLPFQCSGLVSKNLDSLFKPPKECIHHTVRGAILHSPNGIIELFKKQTAAYVIDRPSFDNALLERTGADKLFGAKVDRVSVGKEVKLTVGRKTISSEALVGADGPASLIRERFHQKTALVPGLIAVVNKPSHDDHVELWFDKKATDWFLWSIPRGETTEYGMMGGSFQTLGKFFKLNRFERRSGAIPIGMHKTHFDRTLLVGDAASQTKPWSGGGIVYGLTCGKIAASVLQSALRQGDLSESFLSVYEKEWHREVGRNIRLGLMLREFYKTLSNDQIDHLFNGISRNKHLSGMDMDFPLRTLSLW